MKNARFRKERRKRIRRTPGRRIRHGGIAAIRRRAAKKRQAIAGLRLRRGKKKRRTVRRSRTKIKVITNIAPNRLEAIKAGNLAAGVNLIGFTREEMGIGEASRSTAKALESAQIPFGIIHYPMAVQARGEDYSWRHKETDLASYKVNLFHMNADTLLSAPGYFGNGLFHDRFNIGYWAWELAEFPDEWSGAFSLIDEVWVPSTFILDAVSQKSPSPVIRVPHSIRVGSVAPDRRQFALPEEQFLFLCMFDTHSLSERKNPQAAIDAFKWAFDPDDNSVGLVIKVNNANTFPHEVQKIYDQTRDYGNIFLLPEIMSRSQVNILIKSVDCFVSLHRAEGFGLVLAEAMCLGRPVIGTGWSGNMDYMNQMNSAIVNYNLVQIGRDIGPYKAHQLWAEPDIAHAAELMKRMVDDAGWRQALTDAGRETISRHYSPEAVGGKMRQRLQKLGLC